MKIGCKLNKKEVNNMNKKNIKNRGAKVLGTLAKKVGEFTANTKCVCIYHQPEIPEGIKKMRKF